MEAGTILLKIPKVIPYGGIWLQFFTFAASSGPSGFTCSLAILCAGTCLHRRDVSVLARSQRAEGVGSFGDTLEGV